MRKDSAFLILFRNDQKKEVFLVFRSDYPIWGLTGGGIDKGETPEKAALREAYEETGFKVRLVKPLGVYEIVDKKRKKRKTYLFEGRVVSGTFRPEFPGCLGRWFFVDKMPLSITYPTKIKIQDAVNHQGREFFQRRRLEITFRNNLLLIMMHPFSFVKFFYKYHRGQLPGK